MDNNEKRKIDERSCPLNPNILKLNSEKSNDKIECYQQNNFANYTIYKDYMINFVRIIINFIKEKINVHNDNFDKYIDYNIANNINVDEILNYIFSDIFIKELLKKSNIDDSSRNFLQAKRIVQVIALALLKCDCYDNLKESLISLTDLTSDHMRRVIQEIIPLMNIFNKKLDISKWLPKVQKKLSSMELTKRKQELSEYLDNIGNSQPLPLSQLSKNFGIYYDTLVDFIQKNYSNLYKKFWGFKNYNFRNNFKYSKEQRLIILKDLIISQLQVYSKTGKRLYNIEDIGTQVNISELQSIRNEIRAILNNFPLFRKSGRADVIYDMIFGQMYSSYHDLKNKCQINGFILKTTATEWFDLIKSSNDRRANYWKVHVECEAKHHISLKMILNLDLGFDCLFCSRQTNAETRMYQNCLKLAEKRGLRLISFKNKEDFLLDSEFLDLFHEFKKTHPNNSQTSSFNLLWKCKICGHVFNRTLHNMRHSLAGCLLCYSSSDQLATFKIAKYIFDDYLENIPGNPWYNIQLYRLIDENIIERFPSLINKSVHIDMVFVLNINGKRIILAIEHQGPQHNPNPEIGFKFYKIMTKGQGTSDRWQQLLIRDQDKIKLFKELNKEGYFLIVINSDEEDYLLRANLIIKKFFEETGISLPKIEDTEHYNKFQDDFDLEFKVFD